MERLSIADNNINFCIIEGDLVNVATEDGLGEYPISWVGLTYKGETYYHNIHFLAKFVDKGDADIFYTSKELCEDFIEKIKKYGSVKLDLWTKLEENTYNLEEELQREYEIEQHEQV